MISCDMCYTRPAVGDTIYLANGCDVTYCAGCQSGALTDLEDRGEPYVVLVLATSPDDQRLSDPRLPTGSSLTLDLPIHES